MHISVTWKSYSLIQANLMLVLLYSCTELPRVCAEHGAGPSKGILSRHNCETSEE